MTPGIGRCRFSQSVDFATSMPRRGGRDVRPEAQAPERALRGLHRGRLLTQSRKPEN